MCKCFYYQVFVFQFFPFLHLFCVFCGACGGGAGRRAALFFGCKSKIIFCGRGRFFFMRTLRSGGGQQIVSQRGTPRVRKKGTKKVRYVIFYAYICVAKKAILNTFKRDLKI
jgi:hypothetical protein